MYRYRITEELYSGEVWFFVQRQGTDNTFWHTRGAYISLQKAKLVLDKIKKDQPNKIINIYYE